MSKTPGVHFVLQSLKPRLRDQILLLGSRYHFHSRAVYGKLSVCYEVPDSNKDLIDIWVENFKKMEDHTSPYPDMVKIFQPLLNAKPRVYPLLSGSLIRTDKHAEFLNLDHVLRKNKLDPRHVVWIISRLMNLACLMEKTSTPNLDISTNSVYICPATHEVILLDGWQYARAFNQKAVAAPRKILRLCPDFAVSHHVLVKHVLEQIKALGRELLGDSTGTTLEEKGIPKPLSTWLNKNAGTSATKEFSAWDVVKHESYGKPTFIVLNLTENDVYPL